MQEGKTSTGNDELETTQIKKMKSTTQKLNTKTTHNTTSDQASDVLLQANAI